MPRKILLTHPDTGETKSLTDWAKTLGISYAELRKRYRDYPDDLSKVLSLDFNRFRKVLSPVNHGKTLLTHPDTGETKSLTDWARILDISYAALRNRYRNYPDDIRKVLSPYYLDETEGKTIAQQNKKIAEFEQRHRE